MEEEKSVVEQTKEEFQELIKTINNIKKAAYEIDEIELSNIAITCNNKLVEIMQLFKKKDVKLEHSELGLVVLFYLKKMISDSIDKLNDLTQLITEENKLIKKIYSGNNYFLNYIKASIKKKNFEEIEKKKKQIIDDYEEMDAKVFKFDIEKDILNIFNTEKDFFNHAEEICNQYNKGEERFINNCNVDLRNLGMNVELPCKSQQKEKMLTIFSTADITDDLIAKIDKAKEVYEDYPCIESFIESHLMVYYSVATIELQEGNYEEYQKIAKKIQEFDIEKDLETCLGEYIELSIDDDECDEQEINKFIQEELTDMNKQELYEKVIRDVQNGKYEYIVDLVNKELEKEPKLKKLKK